LGDLLLSAGRPSEAEVAYIAAGAAGQWRQTLCDWVKDPVWHSDMPPDAPTAAQIYVRIREAILGR
jgi:hypothetical protein